MLENYGVLKGKLEISLLNNTKLTENSKNLQKIIEELRKDQFLSYRNMKDLSSQISLLLFFHEKMKEKIYEISPFFDLSVFSDYKKAVKALDLPQNEYFYYANIEQLQENNENLMKKLNKIQINENFHVNPQEFEEISHKNSLFLQELLEKQQIIDNLHEKIKKMQTLEDVKQLILSKTSGNLTFSEKTLEISNEFSLAKTSKLYEKHSKLLEENTRLRKELKSEKIHNKKLAFSHENLLSINKDFQEKIQQYIVAINARDEALSLKNSEFATIYKEKSQICEVLSQKTCEIDGLKTRVLELEKKAVFSEKSRKAIEELLKRVSEEKLRYFEGFMEGQKQLSSILMRHKGEIARLLDENQRILAEKTKEIQKFCEKEAKAKLELMKYKVKNENCEVLLLQYMKRNALNSQIITEQNARIAEITKKIACPLSPLNLEEGAYSGFLHVSQQKALNYENLNENLENQKKSYEELIEKITVNLMNLQQENVLLLENIRNLQGNNEDLQEKLNENLQKIQEFEAKAENPAISNEEIEVFTQEKNENRREIEDLKEKIKEFLKEKEEFVMASKQMSEKIKEISEENRALEGNYEEIKRKYEFYHNIANLKEILLKEQYEIFKGQLKESVEQISEKIKENEELVEILTRKNEGKIKENDNEMEIEENLGDFLNENEVILTLREKNAQLELRLQEKIKEEFMFRTQANMYKNQLEMKVQEVIFGKEKEVFCEFSVFCKF